VNGYIKWDGVNHDSLEVPEDYTISPIHDHIR
jgi:hypothetical protein